MFDLKGRNIFAAFSRYMIAYMRLNFNRAADNIAQPTTFQRDLGE